MKTKFIVEIKHPADWTPVQVSNLVHNYLQGSHFSATVTLAEPLQVRDTMPADGGWIEWKGGECPVELLDSDVTVRFRDGEVYERRRAAREWIWRHSGESDDIVSYRVLP